MTGRILYKDILQKYPTELPGQIWDDCAERLASDTRITIVLDDDPTGTQTVYDLCSSANQSA